MLCNILKRTKLKSLLREQDNVPSEIKLEFLKRYTANCIKIAELRKRKKTSAVNKHIKFLNKATNKELVTLYKFYRVANETDRNRILNTLEKIDKYRMAVNLSITISELSSTLK